MADNVAAEAVNTPGATFATDDDGTAHHPLVKVEWGADGTRTPVSSGAAALPIQDGGNSITVDAASLPLPTGAATAANQASEIALLAGGLPAALAAGGGLKVEGVAGGVAVPVSAAALPLPSGAATAAKQPALGTAGTPSTDVITVQGHASMTALKVDASATTQPVSGTVTANAGTNLNTSLLALESGGNLAAAATSLAIVDDWDESDRAKVNPIVGQAGVDGNSGNKSAATLRVVVATDQPQLTNALKVDGSAVTQPVSAASLPLPSGAATSAKQDSQTTLLAGGLPAALAAGGGLKVEGVAGGVAVPISVATIPSHAVTNAGTFAVQVDGSALTALQLIDDVVATEDAAHGSGDKGVMALAVRRDADTTLADTTGDYAPLQVNAAGSLKVAITSGAGSGGTSLADEASFTLASTSFTPIGGVYNATPDTLADGKAGAAQMTEARGLHCHLVDAAGASLAVGGGTQYTEDAAAAANPIGNALNLIRDDARGGSLTTGDGDNVAARGTNAGELYVKHVDAIPVTDNSGSLTVDYATTGSGTATGALRVELPTNGTGVIATVAAVTAITNALPAGTNAIGKLAANNGVDIGDVDVTSIVPGTGATNLGKAEDAAHTSGDVGVMALSVRQDTAAALGQTDADYQPLITDASGRLHVNVGNTVTVGSHAVTNAGTFAVQESGSALTALQLIDNLVLAEDAAHQSGDPGVQALAVRKDTPAALGADGDYTPLESDANGRLHVIEPSAAAAAASLSVMDDWDNGASDGASVSGDVAHDSVDAGEPVKIGAVAIAHGSNPTAVAAADRTNLYANRAGVPFVIGGHPNVVCATYITTGAQTDDNVLPAISSGTKYVVTGFTITVDSAATVATAVRLGFGASSVPALGSSGADAVAGILVYHPGLVPGAGLARGDGSGILGVGADGEELRITCGAPTTGTLAVSVSYYTIES